jgi:hypothetical protein
MKMNVRISMQVDFKKSDDPLLEVRASVYAISAMHR